MKRRRTTNGSFYLIVFAESHDEDDRSDIFEAMDPFLSFRSLSADVEDTKVEIFEGEIDLDDAGGFHSCAKNILRARQVLRQSDLVEFIEEVFSRIVQLIFVRTIETLLNPIVVPQLLHSVEQLAFERLRVGHSRDLVQD
jgi:hypothetical protein